MAGHCYEFGPFRLDTARRLLSRRGEVIPLTSKVMDTLLVLVENRGRALSKEELMKAVWPDTFVEEGNLTQNVSTLRKLLGESPADHTYIETIPKVGYRFTAGVTDRTERRWLSRRRLWLAGGGVLALLAIAGGASLFRQRTEAPVSALVAVPLTGYPGEEWQPSFSPDGNQVAFAWNGKKRDNFDIYVKLIGTDQPLRLTTDPAEDLYPAWSPDGRSIAFARSLPPAPSLFPLFPRSRVVNHGIFVVPAIGGPERKVAETVVLNLVSRRLLAWSRDSKWLVTTYKGSATEPASLFLLSLETGEKRRLTLPPAGVLGDVEPALSPDGRALAFRRLVTLAQSELYILPVTGDLAPQGAPRRLRSASQLALSPTWTADGREIVFLSGQELSGGFSLWRIPADEPAQPRRLDFFGNDNDFPAISPQGRLAWANVSWDQNIWKVELSRAGGNSGAPQSFIASTGVNETPQFSPDGKRILFLSNRNGTKELWVCSKDGSNTMQLTSMRAPVIGSPRWSPDGQRIVFDANREGKYEVYVISATGGPPLRLTTGAVANWSRDGRWIYFVSGGGGQMQIWKMAWKASGPPGEAVRVTKHGGYIGFESPDGKFLYYSKFGSKRSLWKMPTDGGEETEVLSGMMRVYFALTNGGIYFIGTPDPEGRSCIHFFSFASRRTSPVVAVDGWPRGGIAVSPDGRTLLYSQIDQQRSDLRLLEDFR